MNAKIMAGMAVLGGISLMIAVFLGWLALSAAIESNAMRERTAEVNTGWTKWVNDTSGASDVNESVIQGVEIKSVEFVAGAVLMGMMGVGFLAVIGIAWLVDKNRRAGPTPRAARQPIA